MILFLLHRQTSSCCWKTERCMLVSVSTNTSAPVCVSDVHVCVSQSPCLSQSSLNTNRSMCFCTLRSNYEKRRAKTHAGDTFKTLKGGKKTKKNPYAFSCFLSSSSSCRRLVPSLGSAGRCRRCHGNGGELTVGRGGGDVTASVPVT